MINRFPTWRVWKLLHTYPARELDLLLRVLRVKPKSPRWGWLHNVWFWVLIAFFAIELVYSALRSFRFSGDNFVWMNVLAVSVLTTALNLRFGWSVLNSIFKLREMGSYDLFALLPAGEFISVLNISRTQRYRLSANLRGIIPLIAVILLSGGWYALILMDAESDPSAVSEFFSIGVLWLLLLAFRHYVDYLQSFVTVTLIALLVSQRQPRSDAQIGLIGSFVALQLALYAGVVPFLNLLGWFDNAAFHRALGDPYYVWVIVGVPLIFITVREGINFVLWQAVKRRLEA